MLIHKMSKWTLILVYMLIFVGGLVRASGAGLGCPDWPKCYDRWIPPVSESQLPVDYQEKYHHKGYQDEPFNPVKTWTEYLNRLFGVTVGLFVTGVWILGFVQMRKDRFFVFLSTCLLLLTGFQGWLGGLVVGSALHPLMITLHMVMAIFIVMVGIVLVQRSSDSRVTEKLPRSFLRMVWIVLGLFALQIVMGTQVRELVDLYLSAPVEVMMPDWVLHLPMPFKLHRTFSIVLFVSVLWLFMKYTHLNNTQVTRLFGSMATIVVMVAIEILMGIGLAYGELPPYLQPFHLVISILIFGTLFQMIIHHSIPGYFSTSRLSQNRK